MKFTRFALSAFAVIASMSSIPAGAEDLIKWTPATAQMELLKPYEQVADSGVQIQIPKNLEAKPVEHPAPNTTIQVWRAGGTAKDFIQLIVGPAAEEQKDLNAGLKAIAGIMRESLSPGGAEGTNLSNWKDGPAEDGAINGCHFRRGSWSAQRGDQNVYGLIYISVTPKNKAVAFSSVSFDQKTLEAQEASVRTLREQ